MGHQSGTQKLILIKRAHIFRNNFVISNFSPDIFWLKSTIIFSQDCSHKSKLKSPRSHLINFGRKNSGDVRVGERRERRDKKNGFFGGVQNTYSTHQSKYNDELTGIIRSSAIHQGVQNHHFIPSLILHEHLHILQGSRPAILCGGGGGGLMWPAGTCRRRSLPCRRCSCSRRRRRACRSCSLGKRTRGWPGSRSCCGITWRVLLKGKGILYWREIMKKNNFGELTMRF